MKPAYTIACILALSVAWPAQAQLHGPETFDDCLLKHLPGTQNDMAAIAIIQACGRKFLAKTAPKATTRESRKCQEAKELLRETNQLIREANELTRDRKDLIRDGKILPKIPPLPERFVRDACCLEQAD